MRKYHGQRKKKLLDQVLDLELDLKLDQVRDPKKLVFSDGR